MELVLPVAGADATAEVGVVKNPAPCSRGPEARLGGGSSTALKLLQAGRKVRGEGMDG